MNVRLTSTATCRLTRIYCGLRLCLVSILFPFHLNSLSYITITKSKGKQNFNQGLKLNHDIHTVVVAAFLWEKITRPLTRPYVIEAGRVWYYLLVMYGRSQNQSVLDEPRQEGSWRVSSRYG